MVINKTRRKELSENRRTGILQAARSVFARQGYEKTGVDDIAEQAGIAKGTIYLYFRSKEDIYIAALVEEARRLDELTRQRMQAVEAWDEKLKAYVDVRLAYLETHQDFVRIYLGEFRSMIVRGGRVPSELYQVMRDSEGQLAQVFAAAIAKKEIRSVDPELAALTVCDLTRGLMERWLVGWSRPSGPCDAQFALDLICRSLALSQS